MQQAQESADAILRRVLYRVMAVHGMNRRGDTRASFVLINTQPKTRLAATVCRSFSYLTNPIQGATRTGTHAGPHTLTPEGRCLGRKFSMC